MKKIIIAILFLISIGIILIVNNSTEKQEMTIYEKMEKSCYDGISLSCYNRAVIYERAQEITKAKKFYKKACDNKLKKGCLKYSNLIKGKIAYNQNGILKSLPPEKYTTSMYRNESNIIFDEPIITMKDDNSYSFTKNSNEEKVLNKAKKKTKNMLQKAFAGHEDYCSILGSKLNVNNDVEVYFKCTHSKGTYLLNGITFELMKSSIQKI